MLLNMPGPVCFCVLKALLKKFEFYFIFFFALINILLVFSDHFDVLMSKIIFFFNIILMYF